MSGPTNGAMGQMGMPVIPRPPPFQLEGEGDRVLSKRKLDELVRQVVGGGGSGAAGEEVLSSEVEEVCSNFFFPDSIFPFIHLLSSLFVVFSLPEMAYTDVPSRLSSNSQTTS